MRKKLRDSSGLTMVEMLCATAILVLLCLMMNTGLHMAVRSYQAVTAESETQLLLSSLSDALADKLRYCVVYVDKDSGVYKRCSIGEIDASSGKLIVQEKDEGTGAVTAEKPLLPEGAYGNPYGFYKGDYQVAMSPATLGDIYQKDTNSFEFSLTVTDANLGITKTTALTVRCLNPVRKEVTPP